MSHQESVEANKRWASNDYDAQPRFQLLTDLFVDSIVNLDPKKPRAKPAETETPLSVTDIHTKCQKTSPESFKGSLIQPNTRIIDFACGTGLVAAKLAPYIPQGSVVGIDISRSMLDAYDNKKEQLQKQFPDFEMSSVCGDILDPSFDMASLQESADIVLCTIAFHHFHDFHQIAEKLKGMAKPNGWILIYDFYNEDTEKRSLTAEEKARGVSHAGISLQEMASSLESGCKNVSSAREFRVCVPQPEKFIMVHCRSETRESLSELPKEGELYLAPTSVVLGIAQKES